MSVLVSHKPTRWWVGVRLYVGTIKTLFEEFIWFKCFIFYIINIWEIDVKKIIAKKSFFSICILILHSLVCEILCHRMGYIVNKISAKM